ncbi:hypothetical protein PVW48_19975 [Dinoroseobacter sp. PD6]|uniref:hypothetical protein n=1 Tax=Dinoroseobacter sp. PD6 TaxID=3028384 RepID=UPI00237ACF97|nr:hypothetical protein [Dinoroseobacter sp. PD6]MDD9719038.1 hypothetical protein [Dinoroseobacter sp. PD6]
MLVFHNKRLVIFAVPKTGSTALEDALGPHASLAIQSPPSQRHMNWGAYAAQWQPVLKRIYGIRPEGMAVLREPVARLRSWYRYRAQAQFDGTEWSCAHLDFDRFIAASLAPDPPSCARIGSQDKFVMGDTGQVQIAHLFDYAQMPVMLDWLSARLGREVALAARNRSPGLPAPLDPELEARLRAARAAEFDLYDRVAALGHLHTP